jgi:hypothetical protein
MVRAQRAEETAMIADANLERRNTERIFARAFTLLGGVFWIVAAFAGPWAYGGQSVLTSMLRGGIYPLVFTAGVLTLGWFYERLTALVLALAALGTVAWGVIMQWSDPIVWGVMLSLFVAPTVVAAVLFYFAGNAPAPEPADSDKPTAGVSA